MMETQQTRTKQTCRRRRRRRAAQARRRPFWTRYCVAVIVAVTLLGIAVVVSIGTNIIGTKTASSSMIWQQQQQVQQQQQQQQLISAGTGSSLLFAHAFHPPHYSSTTTRPLLFSASSSRRRRRTNGVAAAATLVMMLLSSTQKTCTTPCPSGRIRLSLLRSSSSSSSSSSAAAAAALWQQPQRSLGGSRGWGWGWGCAGQQRRSHSFMPPASSSSSSLVILQMGNKGDGKKKRPPKNNNKNKKAVVQSSSSSVGGLGTSAAASSSSSSSSASPKRDAPPSTPSRVTSNSLVPVRRQIAFGKLNKELRAAAGLDGGSSSTGAFRQARVTVRTKYRKRLDDDELAAKAEERSRKGQEPDWAVILNRTAAYADPLVMVDGYNVIYKWPRLRKHMVKGDSERARQMLLDDLEDLASLKRWRIECVFDGGGGRHGAAGQQLSLGGGGTTTAAASTATGRAAARAPVRTVTKHGGVRTVYTGRGVEADTYIEGRCMAAKDVTLGATTGSLIVATDDVMIRMAAINAGAVCMGSDRFVAELKAVRNSVSYRVEAAMAMANGHRLRPEALWGTDTFVPNGNGNAGGTARTEQIEEKKDGTIVYVHRYGHGQAIVEDRRYRNKNKAMMKNKTKEDAAAAPPPAPPAAAAADGTTLADDSSDENGSDGQQQ